MTMSKWGSLKGRPFKQRGKETEPVSRIPSSRLNQSLLNVVFLTSRTYVRLCFSVLLFEA